MFQPPVPIAKILEGIHSSTYVLPAIQREFVWNTNQIRNLFESLMRGYPIGSFLFWKVEPEQTADYTFYDFITDYHEKDHPYAQVKTVAVGQGTTAILDGQQRLTALNIGLYGSHAERQPRQRWTNPDAFPVKRLYLNLLDGPDIDELGNAYDLRFLAADEAKPLAGEPDKWFLVADAMKLADSGPAIWGEMNKRSLLQQDSPAFDVLHKLYRAVREAPSVNAFIEESQDPNRVLDIFVRVNSGGTTLSHSDLLLSMATNQWSELDARQEVRSLVRDLNSVGRGFGFNKDFVLKAGLVLTDVPNVAFEIKNFTKTNMALLEKHWTDVKAALMNAATLLAACGYSERTLTANSVAIPIAYYLYSRGLSTSKLESSAFAADRERIRQWTARSLLKRGIWSAGIDTLLTRLREVIQMGGSDFPSDEIEVSMASIGKSLRFNEEEIQELLDIRYGSRRVFPVLAMLYPGLDLSKSLHEDHIYPRSRFTRTRLAQAGVSVDEVDVFIERADALPNLQLLEGLPNVEKQAKLPAEWLNGPHFASTQAREHYIVTNDLGEISEGISGFLEFWDRRRQALETRLAAVLGPQGDSKS